MLSEKSLEIIRKRIIRNKKIPLKLRYISDLR